MPIVLVRTGQNGVRRPTELGIPNLWEVFSKPDEQFWPQECWSLALSAAHPSSPPPAPKAFVALLRRTTGKAGQWL